MLKSLDKNTKKIMLFYCATIFGTLLNVLCSMLNTHVLSPSDFGDVKYVQNFINLASSSVLFGFFVSGSRLLAISKNKEKNKKLRGVLIVVLIIIIFIIMLINIISFFVHKYIVDYSNSILFLYVLPVSGYSIMLNYINNISQGDNDIASLKKARIIPPLVYFIIGFFVYRYWKAEPLIMLLLQWGVGVIVYSILIYLKPHSFKNLRLSFSVLYTENSNYGIYLYVGSLCMVATQYLAALVLGLLCEDKSIVGYYTLAVTVSSPLIMLPQIIGTYYFKKFANSSIIDKKILRNSAYLTVFSCIIYILLITPLFHILYPKSYSMVPIYAQFLAIGQCIHGYGDIFNRFLGSHKKGIEIRNSSIITGLVLVIGNTFFVFLWNINGAIITAIASSIVYTCSIAYYYYLYKKTII